MNRSLEFMKTTANRLAESLSTENGPETLRLMAHLSQAQRVDADERFKRIAAEPLDSLDAGAPIRVGIWESTGANGDGCLRRIPGGDPSGIWAKADRIPARDPRTKRVILLGESVARGFFYDPAFNPATALQKMLQVSSGERVEIVDLAQTDQLMIPLLETLRSSLVLKPDAMVIMAGNNWHPAWSLYPLGLQEVGNLIRTSRNWSALKVFAEGRLRRHLRLFLETISTLSRSSGVPIVFVLPEFNLLDWRDVCPSPPMMEADDTARWLDARQMGEDALRRGNLDLATHYGNEMVSIDHETAPAGFYLLADVKRLSGEMDEARRFLSRARDTLICWSRIFSPRCFSLVQDVMRFEAEAKGVKLIDLPRQFASDLGGELPGQSLFHDYCHLTLEGMRLAMSATAEVLLPVLWGQRRSREELAQTDLEVNPATIAEAHVLSAIYNANWGQSADVVRYHFKQGVQHEPGVARLMSLYADFHLRRVPSTICASFEEVLAFQGVFSLRLLFNNTRRPEEKLINTRLVSELFKALEEVQPEAARRLDNLLMEQHGIASQDIDLLDRAYALESHAIAHNQERFGYYRAFEPQSTFRIFCGLACPVKISITYRIAYIEPGLQKQMSISVNGIWTKAICGESKWRTISAEIPPEALRPGINEIAVNWPSPSWNFEEWLTEVAECFEEQLPADIFPVFGEIHHFTASIAIGSDRKLGAASKFE